MAYKQYTISNSPNNNYVTLTHTSTGNKRTLRKQMVQTRLETDDIIIEWENDRLQIAATDITNLVGATSALRYADLVTTYFAYPMYILTVGAGGDYATITLALAHAATLSLSLTQMCIIVVYPGSYTENITVPPFVILKAEVYGSVIIINATDGQTISFDNSTGTVLYWGLEGIAAHNFTNNSDAIARPTIGYTDYTVALQANLIHIDQCYIERTNGFDNKPEGPIYLNHAGTTNLVIQNTNTDDVDIQTGTLARGRTHGSIVFTDHFEATNCTVYANLIGAGVDTVAVFASDEDRQTDCSVNMSDIIFEGLASGAATVRGIDYRSSDDIEITSSSCRVSCAPLGTATAIYMNSAGGTGDMISLNNVYDAKDVGIERVAGSVVLCNDYISALTSIIGTVSGTYWDNTAAIERVIGTNGLKIDRDDGTHSVTMSMDATGVCTITPETSWTSGKPLTLSGTTASTSTTSGELICAGGAGIAGAAYVGTKVVAPELDNDTISFKNSAASTTFSTITNNSKKEFNTYQHVTINGVSTTGGGAYNRNYLGLFSRSTTIVITISEAGNNSWCPIQICIQECFSAADPPHAYFASFYDGDNTGVQRIKLYWQNAGGSAAQMYLAADWWDIFAADTNVDFNMDIYGSTNNVNPLWQQGTDPVAGYAEISVAPAICIDNLWQRTGMGVWLPQTKLHVVSATDTQMRLGYDLTNYTNLWTDVSGNLNITPTGSSVYLSGDLRLQADCVVYGHDICSSDNAGFLSMHGGLTTNGGYLTLYGGSNPTKPNTIEMLGDTWTVGGKTVGPTIATIIGTIYNAAGASDADVTGGITLSLAQSRVGLLTLTGTAPANVTFGGGTVVAANLAKGTIWTQFIRNTTGGNVTLVQGANHLMLRNEGAADYVIANGGYVKATHVVYDATAANEIYTTALTVLVP